MRDGWDIFSPLEKFTGIHTPFQIEICFSYQVFDSYEHVSSSGELDSVQEELSY